MYKMYKWSKEVPVCNLDNERGLSDCIKIQRERLKETVRSTKGNIKEVKDNLSKKFGDFDYNFFSSNHDLRKITFNIGKTNYQIVEKANGKKDILDQIYKEIQGSTKITLSEDQKNKVLNKVGGIVNDLSDLELEKKILSDMSMHSVDDLAKYLLKKKEG